MKKTELIERITALESRLAELEKTKRRKLFLKIGVAIFVPVGLWAATVIPHGFTDGDTLSATKLNENFQALAAKIDAMEGKSWRLIYEADVTSVTSSITAAGLNGNSDGNYLFITRIVSNNVGCTLLIRPNGDNGANYGDQRVNGINTTTAASRDTAATGLYMGTGQNNGEVGTGFAIMVAKTGYPRYLNSVLGDSITGTTVTSSLVRASVWNNSGTNITSIEFASGTNCIGAGSHIEIWARR